MSKVIVTGGSGFVGKALVKRLHAEGFEVISCSRSVPEDLAELGVQCESIDITSSVQSLSKIVRGADAVFHVAAKVDMWGEFDEFLRINVMGTRNLLQACRNEGVKRFIYTSSPSVIADGTNMEGVDESYPYPQHYEAFYPQTKAIAEQEVLAMNDDELYTCALRPHLIWGPEDTNLIPTILERAKQGKLRQIGEGKNLTDVTYIEDCVEAHVCAFHALASNPDARGKAYFITQDEPVVMWDWIKEVLDKNGMPSKLRAVPAHLAYVIATCCEFLVKILPGKREPLFTRFLIDQMSTHHYFDISRAKELLGYQPKFSMKNAMEKTFS